MKTRLLLAAAGLALLGLLTACGDDADTAAPGSSASQGAHNAQDVAFAQDMIPHHQQAVEMADLALAKRGLSAELIALARQIKAAQDPEIQRMTGWLEEWDEDVPGEHGAGHGAAMADGMLTEEQFAALGKAEGKAFEVAFLDGMIAHHEGAVAMAEEELTEGQDARVKALAQAVVSAQTEEIRTMRALLEKY